MRCKDCGKLYYESEHGFCFDCFTKKSLKERLEILQEVK